MDTSKESTKALLAEGVEERAYWRELADALGYRLYGWTYKEEATLIRPDESLVDFSGGDRAAILALKKGHS